MMRSNGLGLASLFLSFLCVNIAIATYDALVMSEGDHHPMPKEMNAIPYENAQPMDSGEHTPEPKQSDKDMLEDIPYDNVQLINNERSGASRLIKALTPGECFTMKSQNYPRNYPKNHEFKWFFLGTSSESTITVTCSTFSLRKSSCSRVDMIGGTFFNRYSGIISGLTQTSSVNFMFVSFETFACKKRKGFCCQVCASDVATTPTTSTSTTTTTTPTTTSTTTPTTTTTTTSTTTTTTPTTTTTTSTTTTTPALPCVCGRRNPVTKIVGGQNAQLHEHPWQIGIVLRNRNRPFCGGSIVSDKYIVTAAHCVEGLNSRYYHVLIGEHNWGTTSETTATQRKSIAQFIMHPNYDSRTYNNDIALIELTSPITFPQDNKIAPVCLPTNAAELYTNVDAVVTGWGTLFSGGNQPHILQEVTVPTMTNTKCNQLLFNMVTDNMICAGLDAGGKDSCQGDSGGPLVAGAGTTSSPMDLIGVVSWGFGCAEPNQPGVYARVTKYLQWIAGYIGDSLTCPR